MFQFKFPKSVHCHHAVAEATKEKADAAVEAAVIKATVLQAQAVRQAAAQAQALAAAVKADLAVLVDDLANYAMPQRLENGDVLIRRKADAPPPPPLGGLPGDRDAPSPALPDIPVDPDQPEIQL